MPWRFKFFETEQILKKSVGKATPGQWTSNCASEIFAIIDGEEIRIGHFQGCAADAAAVVEVMNKIRGF